MKIFLCEKPSQAKEIALFVGAKQRGEGCFTGNGVAVTWCIGHLLEQAMPEHYVPELKSWDIGLLPVIPSQWVMNVKSSVATQYKVVANNLKKATEVVIATDADREGEVIAREVMQLAGYRGKVSRLWLSAFDDASIKKALGKLLPDSKTLPMYYSGLGRSRADWLAGLNLTMALTKAFGTGGKGGTLHCGRVQTPVLALIVRREAAILNFIPKTFYTLASTFSIANTPVPMGLIAPKEWLDKDGHIVNPELLQTVALAVKNKTGQVQSVTTEPKKESAPLPYSLGALQKEASAKFGMKAQQVLDAAQALYEKHKATTYPRTDCDYLPASMHPEATGVLDVLKQINPDMASLIAKTHTSFVSRAFNDKKITAHHAIIPTLNTKVSLSAMSEREKLIYHLVCTRYIAQFMGDFEYLKTTLLVGCEGYQFHVSGKAPTTLGWQLAYPAETKKKTKAKDEDEEEEISSLPVCKQGDAAQNLSCEVKPKQTTPPKRYTEGTLLHAMESIEREIDDPRLREIMKNKEKAGIGTDATRAAIIEGLFHREYIVNQGKNIIPTDKGKTLIGIIEKTVPQIADPVLTAIWEEQLGKIEAGSENLEHFEALLGLWVKQAIETIRAQAGSTPRIGTPRQQNPSTPHKPADNLPQFACPQCGKNMNQRTGSKGAFWGCTGYPECKNTMNDVDGKPVEKTSVPALLKPGKESIPTPQQPAAATSKPMPSASGSKPPSGLIGQKCPICQKGTLTQRATKDSRAFVGCTCFPACKHFQWIA